MLAFSGNVGEDRRSTCESGMWTPSIKNLKCFGYVTLIVGGSTADSESQAVEVYKPNGWARSLSDFPKNIKANTLDYLNGALYLCGEQECFKGEYQMSSKGK